MLTLECPYCGVMADETELSPGYEAHLKRFGPGSSPEEFEAYIFARKNPTGVHFERWRHSYPSIWSARPIRHRCPPVHTCVTFVAQLCTPRGGRSVG